MSVTLVKNVAMSMYKGENVTIDFLRIRICDPA